MNINEVTDESVVYRASSIDFIGRLQSRYDKNNHSAYFFNIVICGVKYQFGPEVNGEKEKVSNARKKLIEAMMKSEDNHERIQLLFV